MGMIRINHLNTLQPFVITCTELSELPNPKYLFVFTHEMTKDVQRVVLDDMSNSKGRYNLFSITGTFFTHTDWFNYAVYEQESAVNLDESLSNAIVEEGRLYVASDNENPFIENTNSQINFTEYVG